MNPAFSLEGRLVLITGGGTGLGRAMANSIAACGGDVIITGRTEDTLIDTCAEIGERAHYIVHDIRDRESIPALIDQIEATYGPLYAAVSNAGNHLKKSSLVTSDAEFLNVIDTHVLSGFALARECARRMLPRGEGAILFIGSMSAIFGLTDTPAYTASKSALLGMTRELATEYSPRGIRVNIIMPGFIESQMMRAVFTRDPAREQRVLSRTPMARIGEPADIGNAAAFLLSPAAKFISGAELVVDGGMSIGF